MELKLIKTVYLGKIYKVYIEWCCALTTHYIVSGAGHRRDNIPLQSVIKLHKSEYVIRGIMSMPRILGTVHFTNTSGKTPLFHRTNQTMGIEVNSIDMHR